MRKLILLMCAAAALAAPAAASAHRGKRHAGHGVRLAAVEHGVKVGPWKHGSLFAKLTGTGTSFGGATATASGTFAGRPVAKGSFTASLSTDWSKATTKTDSDGDSDSGSVSCAPSTATLTLTDSSASANTVTESVTGKTCALPTNDGKFADVFFGSSTVSSTGGTLAGVTGTGRVLFAEKTDGTVVGFAFTGRLGIREHTLMRIAKHDASGRGH